MTEDEFGAFVDAMDEQTSALREALAEDRGGDPTEDRNHPVAHGGE
jgi:hypothetical protein